MPLRSVSPLSQRNQNCRPAFELSLSVLGTFQCPGVHENAGHPSYACTRICDRSVLHHLMETSAMFALIVVRGSLESSAACQMLVPSGCLYGHD